MEERNAPIVRQMFEGGLEWLLEGGSRHRQNTAAAGDEDGTEQQQGGGADGTRPFDCGRRKFNTSCATLHCDCLYGHIREISGWTSGDKELRNQKNGVQVTMG